VVVSWPGNSQSQIANRRETLVAKTRKTTQNEEPWGRKIEIKVTRGFYRDVFMFCHGGCFNVRDMVVSKSQRTQRTQRTTKGSKLEKV